MRGWELWDKTTHLLGRLKFKDQSYRVCMPGLLLIGSFPPAHKVYHPGSHLAVVFVGWSADAWAVILCPKKPALPGATQWCFNAQILKYPWVCGSDWNTQWILREKSVDGSKLLLAHEQPGPHGPHLRQSTMKTVLFLILLHWFGEKVIRLEIRKTDGVCCCFCCGYYY